MDRHMYGYATVCLHRKWRHMTPTVTTSYRRHQLERYKCTIMLIISYHIRLNTHAANATWITKRNRNSISVYNCRTIECKVNLCIHVFRFFYKALTWTVMGITFPRIFQRIRAICTTKEGTNTCPVPPLDSAATCDAAGVVIRPFRQHAVNWNTNLTFDPRIVFVNKEVFVSYILNQNHNISH